MVASVSLAAAVSMVASVSLVSAVSVTGVSTISVGTVALITVSVAAPSISIVSATAVAHCPTIAISLTRNLHPNRIRIGPLINLLNEEVRIEQVEISKGATGLRLAEEWVGVNLVGTFENVLVVGQRLC